MYWAEVVAGDEGVENHILPADESIELGRHLLQTQVPVHNYIYNVNWYYYACPSTRILITMNP